MQTATLLTWFLLLNSNLIQQVLGQIDSTLVRGASGEDIVRAVARKIEQSFIFKADNNLLIRAAYLSDFGLDFFDSDFRGGIWGISEDKFLQTQQKSLTPLFKKIYSKFAINWARISWMDLEIPLYSGLALSILLEDNPAPIPNSIAEQAIYWAKFIHNDSDTSAVIFEESIRKLESEPSTCGSRMNLIVVLDGSGSVGPVPFTTAKHTIARIVSTLSLKYTKIGMIVYSNVATTVFPLNNDFTSDELQHKILAAHYPGGGTATHLAMDNAIRELGSSLLGTTAPKVILTLTDGRSTYPELTQKSANIAKDQNILTMSLGIGVGVSEDELLLLAGGTPAFMLRVSNFDVLPETVHAINKKVCGEARPGILFGVPTNGTVARKEIQSFKLPMPDEGITVTLQDFTGRSRGFHSQSFDTPSEVINDGVLNANGKTFISPTKIATDNKHLYISVQGIQDDTNYGMIANVGNTIVNKTSQVIGKEGFKTEIVPCGGYTPEECHTTCTTLENIFKFGNCIQFVCICHS